MIHLIQSLVLYLSDEPEKMKYFSETFINRLNQTRSIQFIQDKKIQDEFFISYMKNESSVDFEHQILKQINKLKHTIQENKRQQARELSNQILFQYEQKLLKHAYVMSNTTHVDFYFWNTIANLDTPKAYELAEEFLNSVTLTQKNLLEGQLTREVYKKYLKILTNSKTLPKLTVTIQNSKNCAMFLNGRAHDKETLLLSKTNKIIFTAVCTDGFYSQLVRTQSNSVIKITPKINKSFAHLPTFDSLPWETIKKGKYQYLTLIYWSKKSHYIQTIVTALPQVNNKYTLLLQLKAKNDLQTAGDKMFEFISSHFKYLIELDTF